MTIMILGLVVFLGVHSIRIVAEPWRQARIRQMGLMAWKGLYSVVALIGLVLVIWGYGQTRLDPVWVWQPPTALRHLTLLLMIPAMILLVAAYVPGNALKARLGHPMLLAVKVWALAHLLANGRLSDIILFVAFLIWAVLAFRAARRREPAAGGGGRGAATLITMVLGLVLYGLFAGVLHAWLIGVPVMPGA
ncbi:NnrU family protein [Alloalcanivorax profundimaris]|uniref:NnrU family protein n=1 Tax=Alloalcanivorax profundimaris TaxID=2735259 RepID=UPI00136CDCCC|nr:NnrU family protein [Alloalcanivorax profundimaris]MBF1802466.1 NnrU family protein [Alloalcanivorax profundimaris]MBM1144282.1 NnrU family protein [Alcanivorax sp. ZXX171]